MKNNWRIHLGYWLMLVALAIPLFTFGRMVYQGMRQVTAYEEYNQSITSDDLKTIKELSGAYNSQLNSQNNIVDPFLSGNYRVEYGILDHPNAIYGYLSIPSLEIMEPVYLGATLEHMGMGLAHVDGTSLPSDEMGIRSVIAGHRAEPTHVFFRHLDKLEIGDKLYFDNGTEIITYQMVSSEVILPSEWEKLLPKTGENWMTLITCDPIPVYNKRLLVNFERIGQAEKQAKTEKEEAESTTEKVEDVEQAFTRKGQKQSKVASSKWLYSGICLISLLGLVVVLRNYIKRIKG